MPPITQIPLTLYVHIPWCTRKCPYCDFNSHRAPEILPQKPYIRALLNDLRQDLAFVGDRPLQAIFIGGGTPSLLSPEMIDSLLQNVRSLTACVPAMEVTLEANPGSAEHAKFNAFRQAGVNRLSLGIQSFDDDKLCALGRVHNGDEARAAVEAAQASGIEGLNLDLMHGLPGQTVAAALGDLQIAVDYAPHHLSWYQLTIEPQTAFAKRPPHLPPEETLWKIYRQGARLLKRYRYRQYEISAYCRDRAYSRHNLNYWLFGDYLGIGAGAHGKITCTENGGLHVRRYRKHRSPRRYLAGAQNFIADAHTVPSAELAQEYMMNALRLNDGAPIALFRQRTGLDYDAIAAAMTTGREKGLLEQSDTVLRTTTLGRRFLNDCLQLFAP